MNPTHNLYFVLHNTISKTMYYRTIFKLNNNSLFLLQNERAMQYKLCVG